MKVLKPIFSVDAPSVRDALWLKPVEGGILAYVMEGGVWVSLKPADDQGTETTKDDVAQDLIGSVKDKASANTINGAKAYAKDIEKSIKSYVDEKIAALNKKG